MIFAASYVVLGFLLMIESLVLAYVLRGTVRAAVDHEARRSSPIGLPPEFGGPTASGADSGVEGNRLPH